MTLPRAAEPDDAVVGAGGDRLPEAPSPSRLERATAAYGRLEARVREPRIRRRLEIAAPVAILALAAVARLTALGHPHLLVFDETYYVKEAWSVWQLGYEGEWGEGADERFEAGDPGALTAEPDYVVHPPLGKWIIGMAMAVFGMADPSWWRLPSALAGIALVGLTYAIARGLTRSVAFASLAGLWMAIDGLAIVMSRTALLDGILAVFVLAGAGALLLDRRGSPARTVRALAARTRRFGAAMWSRPWIVIAGVLLGAACATKWSGAVFLAVFGLWIVASDALDRRRAGFRHPWIGTLLTQAPTSFVLLVGPALVVYVASYVGWFDGGWGSQLALERADLRWGGLLAWVPLGLQSLWMYHAQQLGFHVGLTKDHAYQSPAIEWLWLGRPTGFEMATTEAGVWWITAVPNLLVWYAGVLALAFLLFHFGRTLDPVAGFLLLGVAAGWVPWLLFPDRTIFFFYAIVMLPFVVIALAYALRQLVGPPGRRGADAVGPLETDVAAAVPSPPAAAAAATAHDALERRAAGWAAIAVIVVVSIAVSLWFLPVWYGIALPEPQIRLRYWPPSWP
ncbi:dolichyl-phosphate-mannose--protein mannosyltransferase [Agrococcus carbonis]|uniref:Polyprenol-phosphate-mannose--protein mannosyltransferase n=1 Tax=Agrococcus carbonis TaxID=684552 RepID=A0A1H1RNI0_9MICO|nr:phospholipid carrier-dependent glycosyltransferase [Agrococcus carbonis]SDS37270.1 Dolichyl-phosphate-mannose-protein mannosyltransferase [Agrococcus carbonis]